MHYIFIYWSNIPYLKNYPIQYNAVHILASIYCHISFINIKIFYFAWIGVILEALTFVFMLTVYGYTKENYSVECSYRASVLYTPIDKIYRIDIFIFYNLKIICCIILISLHILHFFYMKLYHSCHKLHPFLTCVMTAITVFINQHNLWTPYLSIQYCPCYHSKQCNIRCWLRPQLKDGNISIVMLHLLRPSI
jgi:hypothetical protein